MATISEVVWFQTSYGKCPICGRKNQKLGMTNVDHPVTGIRTPKERCIDCCFGMPCEYWDEEMWVDEDPRSESEE